MKSKNSRLQTLRMLISSQELCCQDEVLKALEKEGYKVTQATLSRDMKQLKVAKATSLGGKYFYVLPNETMYKRVASPKTAAEMLLTSGFMSINFRVTWASSRHVRGMRAVWLTISTTAAYLLFWAPLPATTPYLS